MDKENTSKLNELDESIPDRDVKFESTQNEKLYAKYVNGFVTKIKLLKKDKAFVLDNSFNEVKASHHIMYKCKVNDNGETLLLTPDGHIGYEFLVEFDKKDPQYGIYYGCRGHIKEGNQKKGIKRIKEDWEKLEGEVAAVLNNTFVDKDFSKRFQMTNNANNKTYWPFWISLGADEDVIKVAARATKLICNVYKKYKNGWQPQKKDEGKKIPVRTKYTEEAWDDILKLIKKNQGIKGVQKYRSFIRKMEKNGIINRDDRYEKCWKFCGLNNVEVKYLLKEVCNKLHLFGEVPNDTESEIGNADEVPWEYFTPILLSKFDRTLDYVRNSQPTSTRTEKKTVDRIKGIIKLLKIN